MITNKPFKMLFNYCACVLVIVSPVLSFSHGAPEFSCKDPSTFHTRRINATHEGIIMPGNVLSNPYKIEVDTVRYRPGEKITVMIESTQPDKPLRGFFLQAIQSGVHIRDLRRRAFGTFENITADEHPTACQTFGDSATGGITHSNSRDKQRVIVTWIAPATYNPGDVQFLATGVLDYYTYWTDIRSPQLVPDAFPSTSDNTITGRFTPTAAWYRWLQYIRQQQLIKQHLGIPITVNVGAEHDHHHHDHDHHDHDHSHSNTNAGTVHVSSTSTRVPPSSLTTTQKPITRKPTELTVKTTEKPTQDVTITTKTRKPTKNETLTSTTRKPTRTTKSPKTRKPTRKTISTTTRKPTRKPTRITKSPKTRKPTRKTISTTTRKPTRNATIPTPKTRDETITRTSRNETQTKPNETTNPTRKTTKATTEPSQTTEQHTTT